jgi:hypothetical protein
MHYQWLQFQIGAGCTALSSERQPTTYSGSRKKIDASRLLIISTSEAPRQSRQTAFNRNEYIAELSDNICFVDVTEKSSLYPLTRKYSFKIMHL